MDVKESINTILCTLDEKRDKEITEERNTTKLYRLTVIEKYLAEIKHIEDDLRAVINAGFYKSPQVTKNININISNIANTPDAKKMYAYLQISWRGVGLTTRTNFQYIHRFADQLKIFVDDGCTKEIAKHLTDDDKNKLFELQNLLKQYKQSFADIYQISTDVIVPPSIYNFYTSTNTIATSDVQRKLTVMRNEYGQSYRSLYLNELDCDSSDNNMYQRILSKSIVKTGYDGFESKFINTIFDTYYRDDEENLINRAVAHEKRHLEAAKALQEKISKMFEYKLTFQKMLGNDVSTFR